jgi:DNA-binding transcriptional regulator YdaS (Cro superfamily)
MAKKFPKIEEVFKAAGGRKAVAERFGIQVPSTYSWKRVPADRVLVVSKMTGIAPEILRPDLAAIFNGAA